MWGRKGSEVCSPASLPPTAKRKYHTTTGPDANIHCLSRKQSTASFLKYNIHFSTACCEQSQVEPLLSGKGVPWERPSGWKAFSCTSFVKFKSGIWSSQIDLSRKRHFTRLPSFCTEGVHGCDGALACERYKAPYWEAGEHTRTPHTPSSLKAPWSRFNVTVAACA